ncbi:MAG: hypothetical protein AAGF54_15985 [Pseudomonadota bacterium]
MENPVLIFLAIAVFIIVMAFFLSWAFRKTIRRDRKNLDPNARHDDGTGVGTHIGIDHLDGEN